MRIVIARAGGSRLVWRGSWTLALVGVVALLLAACGGGSGGSSGGGPYGSGTSSTATSAPAGSGAEVKTASVSVKGSSKTVLTDAKGMTLYYWTKDTPGKSTCTSACATKWPPLLASGSGMPTSATTLPGTLSAFDGANGHQVQYNGHPLYTYAGDTAAGQANGEGIGGIWFVATPDLAGAGGGYGYGG